jgi:hypothetical protein
MGAGMAVYEKPLPGNPHGLTINQHIFPRSGIARFENRDGRVQVRRTAAYQRIFTVKPVDPMFCAKRVWDQRTETLHSRSIETNYAALADMIASGKVKQLDASMSKIVSLFHDLCCSRYEASRNPHPDMHFNRTTGDPDLNQDKQEMLEKMGVLFIRPDGKMSGRSLTGMQIVAKSLHLSRAEVFPPWGIFRALEGQFIVPDNFMVARCIPVSPTIIMLADLENNDLRLEAVAELNSFHIARAGKLCFARDFSACPVTKRTIPCRQFSFKFN